jgi:ubiquinone/menaquinone biosynthesis C-methylase UbiE
MATGDRGTLRTVQYRDGRNLQARLDLHRRFATNPQPFHRWMLEHLPALDGLRILDVGAGTASFWTANRDRLPTARTLVLSDFSPGMLRDARRLLGDAAGALRFAGADAMALPFGDASFDAVFANHMLYHVPDRPRCFAEIQRVLASGGWLAAATNGVEHLDELEALLHREGIAGADAVNLAIAPFSLQNGGDQLAARFCDVRLLRHEDALAVTEVEPLLAYVRSMTRLEGDAAQRVRAAVERAIAERGAFGIRKDPGFFLARR